MTDDFGGYTGDVMVGEGPEPDPASVRAAQEILNPLLPMIARLSDPDVVISIVGSILVTAALRFADPTAFLDDVRRAVNEGLARAQVEVAGFMGPRQ